MSGNEEVPKEIVRAFALFCAAIVHMPSTNSPKHADKSVIETAERYRLYIEKGRE